MKNVSARNIGLFTGAAMVLTSVILFYVFKFPDTGITKYVSYCILSIGVLIAQYLYFKSKKSINNFSTYFSEGFKVFVVSVFIMAVFTFVFYKLNPQIFESKLIDINAENSKDPSKTAAEVIENGEKIKNIFMPMTIAMNTIFNLAIGGLVSLLGAGFFSQQLQKNN